MIFLIWVDFYLFCIRSLCIYFLSVSVQEHIEFIRAIWSLLTNPGMETRLLDVFARSLSVLLSRKDLLSPADLQLEWKPLYLLLEDLSSHNVLMNLKVSYS